MFLETKNLMPSTTHAPFSLESLIAWLEKQPGERRYGFCQAEDGCLWALYTIEQGGHFNDATNTYVLTGAHMSATLDGDTMHGDVAVGRPRTMQGALDRARAYAAKSSP